MTLSLATYTNAIQEHSDALAEVAPRILDLPLEHCPGWTGADLLQHLIEVHWFWATVVEHRLDERPTEGRPHDIARSELVQRFASGATHLVDVLGRAPQSDQVWTWAPAQHDVAFVTRHQVQEIVVHHWDADHALGAELAIAGDVAGDAVEEFLTFSVSSPSDPADPPRAAFDGALGLWASDANLGWTIHDADVPGTIEFSRGVSEGTATLQATSADLLLWLYARVELRGDERTNDLAQRFRALCFTD